MPTVPIWLTAPEGSGRTARVERFGQIPRDDIGQANPAIFTAKLAAERQVEVLESELAVRRFSIHLATVTCKGLKGNRLISLHILAQKQGKIHAISTS